MADSFVCAFKVQPNNFQWEGVAGQDGVHGRKCVPHIPTVEANIPDDGILSLQELVAMVGELVTVEPNNGKTYFDRHARLPGLAEFNTSEGRQVRGADGV